MWRGQLTALSTRHRIIAPDHRGFGETDGFREAPSIDQMADDAARLLDAIGVETTVLAGLSMGGYVALAFARRHPHRLRALILADTKAEADSPEAKVGRDKLIAFMKDHSGGDLIELLMPKMVSASTRKEAPELVEAIRQLAAGQSPAGIIGALIALRDRPDSSTGLHRIAVPTLVIVGEDDVITPPSDADALAVKIPGAVLKRIPHAGHLSNLEQPATFNSLVAQFLATLA
jgi:pimeloyl-ACP methyl ester carboxylesterase